MTVRHDDPATPLPEPGTAAGAGDEANAYRLRAVGLTLPTSGGPLDILRDIDLEVPTGQVVSIVGRSGTGKTTLLRLLGGLVRPTTGSAELFGRPITAPPAEVVTVFQDYAAALLPWRTLARNVALPLEGKVGAAERKQRVTEALTMVGLQDRADDYPWRLSGGMQQRVQIARGLALRPRVLLMDEPFGALDAMTKALLQDQLLLLQRETGATIVIITHDLEEAIYLGDTVCLIAGAPGRITFSSPTGLPAERDQVTTRELDRYLAVRHRLHEALREQADQ